MDNNEYRGNAYAGRDRSKTDDGSDDTIVVNVAAGTANESEFIKNAIAQVEATHGVNKHVTIQLGAGNHFFEKTLSIHRSDVTIKGAGEDSTKIIGNFAGNNIIEFRPTSFEARSDNSVGTKVTSVAGAFAIGDTTLNVANGSNLKAGDQIMLVHSGVNSTKNVNFEQNRSMAEIDHIVGNTLHLKHKVAFTGSNFDVNKVTLLENIALKDFTMTHNITESMIVNPFLNANINFANMDDYAGYNFVPNYAAQNTSNTAGNVLYGDHRALVVAGTHEANVSNITFENTGSTAFFSGTNMELSANNLTFDGTMNRGTGGNGYGYELRQSFYSDVENLNIYDMRHGVSYNLAGISAYNNIHIQYSDNNVDFHGGADKSNIYNIDKMVFDPVYIPQWVGGTTGWSSQYYVPTQNQWRLVELRHASNDAENTFEFKHAVSTGELNNQNNTLLVTQHINFADVIYARDDGAVIYAGAGNDTVYGGAGADSFVFAAEKSGGKFNAAGSYHEIVDFDTSHDTIVINQGTNGYTNETDLLPFITQVGSDVRVELGAQDALLRNVNLNNISIDDFDIAVIQKAADGSLYWD
jgi:RTX calcium-binding nonapeptide repeat (4 copies)